MWKERDEKNSNPNKRPLLVQDGPEQTSDTEFYVTLLQKVDMAGTIWS